MLNHGLAMAAGSAGNGGWPLVGSARSGSALWQWGAGPMVEPLLPRTTGGSREVDAVPGSSYPCWGQAAWQDPHSLRTMRLVVDDGQSLDILLTSFLAPYRDGPAAAADRGPRAAVD
jgi:hypothetical protein